MLVALVVAAVFATVPASAGSLASDPMSLVLQRSDVPAKAVWRSARDRTIEKTLAAAGIQGRAAYSSAEVDRGRTETLLVSSLVIVLPDAGKARQVFASYKILPPGLRPADVVRLPAYGDDQYAIFPKQRGLRTDLRVLRGSAIWRVQISWAGAEPFTRAQMLAELKTYATKLKRRVGRG
jgi:hypothetical protein